jgi:hypothetical protein
MVYYTPLNMNLLFDLFFTNPIIYVFLITDSTKLETVTQGAEENIWSEEGSMRDEVTGGWRKLHNEELHDLYSRQA